MVSKQTESVFEKAGKNNKIIVLRDRLFKFIVFFQKPNTLFRGRVDSQMFDSDLFTSQHVVKQFAPKTSSLLRLVNVKIENTERRKLVVLSSVIENKQTLFSYFEHADKAWILGRVGFSFHQVEAMSFVEAEFSIRSDDFSESLSLSKCMRIV